MTDDSDALALATAPRGPPPAPMGERGQYPVVFSYDPNQFSGEWIRGILAIPGTIAIANSIACTWDVAWAVARLLSQSEPEVPAHDGELPGLARYRALCLHKRTWPKQKEDVLFLARRSGAIIAEPMRSGKTLAALAAAILVDSRKTLVICPKYARLGWADEIQEWTKEAAVLLCGRGAREVRVRCLTCRGLGRRSDGESCLDCRARNGQSYGYRIFDVPPLEPKVLRTADGYKYSSVPPTLWCRRHPEVERVRTREDSTGIPHCGKCYAAMLEEIRRARFLVVNYELLVQQHTEIGGGVMQGRADLAGWVDTLKQIPIDVCIQDEAHNLRGWTTAKDRLGERRNEKTLDLVGHIGTKITIPRVWMVTGTPFFGFTRDIFWLIEIASGGLWGGLDKLRGMRFMNRYAGGKKGDYGYEAKGRSIFAETELMRRLNGTKKEDGTPRFDGLMIQRTREELFADAPPIRRQVIHLELDNAVSYVRGRSRGGVELISRLIMANTERKLEAVKDRFMNELAEGNKIVVFTFHVASAKKTFLAIEKEMASHTFRTRMKQVNAKAWLATGVQRKKKKDVGGVEPSPSNEEAVDTLDTSLGHLEKGTWAKDGDARYALARAYREHEGAGVLVATIDSMPGALSLKGASAVYFLDLHWSPGAIAQAENRPWHPEVKNLSVIHIIARDSIDDHLEAEVLPKVETLARLGREQGAAAMLEAFSQPDETRTVEAVWARLMRHLKPQDMDVEAGEGDSESEDGGLDG